MSSPWFSVGLASSYFPVTDANSTALSELPTPTCKYDSNGDQRRPIGCKVFLAPSDGSSRAIQLSHDPLEQERAALKEGRQVLVFKYNGKMHAVDNKCPHTSYPLSNASPFDIEDFGITLSAGLTCPKHSWSFDLFTGASDRGKYRLGIWDAKVCPATTGEEGEQEVWVRRRDKAMTTRIHE
ncbi:hypothetical protein P280DRAFT_423114 [Massarina eburnea CBS 473.64]|uniref:Rieske domain-containing protein n=1 Tax=Massarina eburnea CBS 473.64 TaxID=1395130 RepID=A0A6A6S3H3_9PLEO|nr:hypothetical protein P280DRAFT_423114 [Massarina eburnea CBS 473.64]